MSFLERVKDFFTLPPPSPSRFCVNCAHYAIRRQHNYPEEVCTRAVISVSMVNGDKKYAPCRWERDEDEGKCGPCGHNFVAKETNK